MTDAFPMNAWTPYEVGRVAEEVQKAAYRAGFDAAKAENGPTVRPEAIRADERARIRAKVAASFADTKPPYLFPHNEDVLFPKMERTHVNDVIRDVWQAAEEQVLALINGIREKENSEDDSDSDSGDRRSNSGIGPGGDVPGAGSGGGGAPQAAPPLLSGEGED
jgi:hypothetical protein